MHAGTNYSKDFLFTHYATDQPGLMVGGDWIWGEWWIADVAVSLSTCKDNLPQITVLCLSMKQRETHLTWIHAQGETISQFPHAEFLSATPLEIP